MRYEKIFNTKILSVLLLLGLLFSYAPQTARAEIAAQPAVTVEDAVLQDMQTNGTASYYLNFANTADLSPAYTMNWSDRGWFVYETLKAQMETSQAGVQSYLSNAGVEFRSFWITTAFMLRTRMRQFWQVFKDLKAWNPLPLPVSIISTNLNLR